MIRLAVVAVLSLAAGVGIGGAMARRGVQPEAPAPTVESATPQLDAAVESVRRRLEESYISTVNPNERPFWSALLAMDYVAGQVDAGEYAYRARNGMAVPTTIESAFETGAGICGAQGAAFVAICRRMGLQARLVQIYNIDHSNGRNHVAAEVNFGGRWRFYDPTSRAYFIRESESSLEPLSLEDIRRADGPRPIVVVDASNPWRVAMINAGFDPLDYLNSATADIMYDGKGIVRVSPVKHAEDAPVFPVSYSTAGVPSFVGATRLDEYDPSVVSDLEWLLLDAPAEANAIVFDDPKTQGEGQLVVNTGENTFRLSIKEVADKAAVSFPATRLPGEIRLRVEPADSEAIAYLTFAAIRLESH